MKPLPHRLALPCPLLFLAVALASPPGTHAAPADNSFALIGQAIGGGGTSSGGTFTLTGSVPVPGGWPVSGGDFRLICGLIGASVVPTPGSSVELSLEILSGNQARLSWPGDVAGYQLEFTPTLAGIPVWQPVSPAPSNNSFTTPFDQPTRFYRLRKL